MAPTAAEALRVKAYLAVQRNVVRDYLDVVAELPRYKGLDPRWHDWSVVVGHCRRLALRLGGAA